MPRRRHADPLPEGWRGVAGERLRQWPLLDDAERARLERLTARLLSKRWEASNGFAVDDAMKVTVALNAALLHLARDDEPFANVTSVVIHPTTMVLRGERPGLVPGTVTNAPLAAHGHTTARGPVFIAWDAVEREMRTSGRSGNVVLHEFAHKIDALNGMFDGTPQLESKDQLREWVEVCTAELRALRRGEPGVLRSYAATNPSEFFAVATEAFFEQPVALRDQKPALYRVLFRFYGQDTAAREPQDGARVGPADNGISAAVTRHITSAG